MSRVNGTVEEIIRLFIMQKEVVAIALGGSRASGKADEKSDYDIYVYLNNTALDSNIRKNILSPFCSYMEIENTYWELGDNGILNNGICIDLLYRWVDSFINTIADVVEKGISYNGYTTSLWDNLMSCEILYDRNQLLHKAKERFSVSYPQLLKMNIIKRNMNLLTYNLDSYENQIKKSIFRRDIVNIHNRISAFLDSYFDVLFALNELKNTGEKRLMENCSERCKILPNGFEENIKSLLHGMTGDIDNISKIIEVMIYELKNIVSSSNFA